MRRALFILAAGTLVAQTTAPEVASVRFRESGYSHGPVLSPDARGPR